MAAARKDIVLEKGATWTRSLALVRNGAVWTLTGYTARMKIRESLSSSTAVISLTSEAGGGIVITAPTGIIVITITSTVTAALTIERGVFDLELVESGGTVHRLWEGNVSVSEEATR